MVAKPGSKAGSRKDAGAASRKPVAGKRTWVVTTSLERPVREIAKELTAAGFEVDQTLDEIGVITGKSDDKSVAKARTVRGVTDVSPEPEVDIGPPGSRDTW
jgi:hypothetical protein